MTHLAMTLGAIGWTWGIWWIAALTGAGALLLAVIRSKSDDDTRLNEQRTWGTIAVGALLASMLLWTAIGNFDARDSAAAAVLSLSSFAIGSLLGFVFTVATPAEDSLSRVRDWLVGGLSTLTIAGIAGGDGKFAAIFQAFAGTEKQVSAAVLGGVATAYTIFGFYVMYVLRVTSWNPWFAHHRDQLAKKGTQVENAVLRTALPDPRDIEQDVKPVKGEDATGLRRFAAAVKASEARGESPTAETRWTAARALVGAGRADEAINALWPFIATNNSHEVDARLWMARCLEVLDRQVESVAFLEPLLGRADAPANIEKLLGYYLLWNDARLDDSLKHTAAYLVKDPNDPGAHINLACAHAQLMTHDDAKKRPAHRKAALAATQRAIELNKDSAARIADLRDLDFAALRDDDEFKALIGKK